MGSKYPQSSLKCCFSEIKELLLKKQVVLFSGTPCQVYGLKAYLRNNYDNLITLDFVCHGVASPKIWREYLQLFIKEKPVSITFKDKVKGWKKWHVKYELKKRRFINMEFTMYSCVLICLELIIVHRVINVCLRELTVIQILQLQIVGELVKKSRLE